MQLPVAAAPGVLLIVRKKCNLLLGNVKTYSFTSVLITGEFVVILLLFYSSCTDKAIQEFLDVTEHDSASINMTIDSVS